MSVRVAIYARKSTSQESATEEAKSPQRQIELARAFIGKQDGWVVSDDHVFRDDKVSGAVFDPTKRPGLAALLQAAKSTPRPFDVLVYMNQSRLARKQRYAVDLVHDLTDCGVRIFSYQTGLERKMDSSANRFMVGVDAFQDEAYRESVRITTRETLRRKAERGEVAGGELWGYVNISIMRDGTRVKGKVDPKTRSHVVREVNPEQAAVVVRFFEMLLTKGLLRTAKTLNAEAVPSPGGRGWSPATLRSMVYNQHYRGVIVYGKTRWQDQGDTKVKVRCPEADWVTVHNEALRIIPDDLWHAVHARLAGTQRAYLRRPGGTLWGRPGTGVDSPHLLSGFSVCGLCGASLFVRKRRSCSRAAWRSACTAARGITCAARRSAPTICTCARPSPTTPS